MRDPRLTGISDPLLSPLLERLAMLETAKEGLEYKLSDRDFTAEMQNSMLREQLENMKAEFERQRGTLDNFCQELLAAMQERDRAQASVEMSLQLRDTAVKEREAMRLRLEAALNEQAQARAASEMSLKIHDKATAERDEVRLKLNAILSEKYRLEAEVAQAHAEHEPLLKKVETAIRVREALTGELAALETKLEADRQASRESTRTLKESLNTLQNASESQAPMPVEGLLDPIWAKVIPTLRRPMAAALARLRQVPLGPIPAGPRAMIRMAAVSLTQTSDMLKSLEEFFDDGGAPPQEGRAEVPIEAALAAWEGPFRQRRIKIVRRMEISLPQVLIRGDSLRVAVFQVLRNVYDSLPGGGTLNIHVSRDPASGGITARFSDTGPGFSPKALDSLFTPFSSARTGHLGLGLCLGIKILRRFGG